MTFKVHDLMIDVLPQTNGDAHELHVCEPDTAAPKPKPKPRPPQEPACVPITLQTGVEAFTATSPELAALAVLREQLHQALHP
jgi:hypothetical protein